MVAFGNQGELLQGCIEEYDAGYPSKLSLSFETASDPLIIDLFDCLHAVKHDFKSSNWYFRDIFQPLIGKNYFHPYKQEFFPTCTFQFIKMLSKFFPKHKLLISDFNHIPDSLAGWNAPLVQTRYKGQRVVSSTLLVEKGKFDIFFPTDFKVFQKIYHQFFPSRASSILSNYEFMKRWADYKSTRTKSGFNPLLEEFQNVNFFLSL